MKEHYCTYEQAVKLKELGFDWKCICFYPITSCLGIKRNCSHANFNSFEMSFNCDKYGEIFSAPRLDQAQKWLREVKNIYVYPEINCLKKWFAKAVDMERNEDLIWDGTMFDTYESALSAGIDKALELLTDKLSDK